MKQEILFVKKQDDKIEGLDTSDVIFIFENSDNLERIKEAVKLAKDRLYVSWASVEMRDKAGELIPIDDMVKQLNILMERNAPITDEHTNKIVGQTLAYKVMTHPETGTGGILLLNRIYNHNELDDQVWQEIVSGERKGSSVGGYNTNASLDIDPVTGERVRVLEGFNWIENASVHEPCNPLALNESYSIVAKSASSNKEEVKKPFAGYKDFDDCVAQNSDKEDPKAYCATIMRQVEGKNKENVINKEQQKDINKTTEGDVNMTEEINKALSELSEVVKKLNERLENLEKQAEEEKKPKEEEEEEPESEEKNVKKEEAKSDIEGEEDAKDQPETPKSEDNNSVDVYKKEDIDKKFDELKQLIVEKASTPAPVQNVKKKEDPKANYALELAMGKKRDTFLMVNKTVHEIYGEE